MPAETSRELVIMVDPASGFRTGAAGVPTAPGADLTGLTNVLRDQGATIRPMFGRDDGELHAAVARVPVAHAPAVSELANFYRVTAPDERLDAILETVRRISVAKAAYIKPVVELPVMMPAVKIPPIPAPAVPAPPGVSPDFSGLQGYLDAAPSGIDARFAWTLPGGRGQGVEIIDIEGSWLFTHEDLTQNQGGMVAGTEINDPTFRNHGTAVISEIGGDDNGFGVIGIAPDARVRAVSHGTLGLSQAITTAANLLSPGDILLLEAHQPGPRFNFQPRADQLGYIAVQYWPDSYAAITFATVVKGVIVVEAAGNGAENLDDPLYSTPQPGFPLFWQPFNRLVGDNAAIIVGAGSPPPGTHGNFLLGPDRSRLNFSNFGACVDAQGWGAEVTSCGYGGLQGGPLTGLPETTWYTNQFGGTSSASPIVTGALACLQGILKAAGKPLLTPISARNLLQTFGSVQQDGPGVPAIQHIGNRPDLFLMAASL
jgi:hypothetical protein